jgi:hypothetical protein
VRRLVSRVGGSVKAGEQEAVQQVVQRLFSGTCGVVMLVSEESRG